MDTEIAKLLTGHSIGIRGRYLNYSENDLLKSTLRPLIYLLSMKQTDLERKWIS